MIPQIAMISPTEPKVNEDIALGAEKESTITCNRYKEKVPAKTMIYMFM